MSTLKVIGAGYGRTGTKSLKTALEKLGYGKCYHMEELLSTPEHVKYWKDAMEGKPVNWEELFGQYGYQSAVDFPTSLYYKELAAYYPEAKVILSIRDAEKWYKSVYQTIYTFEPEAKVKLKMLLKMPFSGSMTLSLNELS